MKTQNLTPWKHKTFAINVKRWKKSVHMSKQLKLQKQQASGKKKPYFMQKTWSKCVLKMWCPHYHKQSSLLKMQQLIEVDACKGVWSMNKPTTK